MTIKERKSINIVILDIPEVTEIGLYSYKTLPNKRIV